MRIRQKLVVLGLVLHATIPFSDASALAQDRALQPNAVSVPENGQGETAKDNLSIASISPTSGFSIGALVSQYAADQKTLEHRFRLPLDTIGQEYRMKMLQSWQLKLASIDFSQLDQDNQIDWLLLDGEIRHDRNLLDRKLSRNESAKSLIPYFSLLLKYCASKEYGSQLSAEDSANVLDEIANTANELSKNLKKPNEKKEPLSAISASTNLPVAPITAIHATNILDQFSRQIQDTHRYHEGYDPKYTWWAAKPFEAAKLAVANHRKAIREKLAGLDENDTDKIVGIPIGSEALVKELQHAWIPYTAQELILIGERELKWCDDRFKEAANELKLDGDWRKALAAIKLLHAEPGDQPRLIRELAWEAIRFVEGHDLLTIPEMAKQGWRVEMMTPEAQKVNPYFLGGDNIIVSFPTNTMTHSEKLMSLKSNNIHFCRATVHHELIPGHHLQYYSLARFRNYRELFSSPFWMEGWALYWEMKLWDMNFAQSPEDRVGMLFWRRHRAARIVFSLNYQLGKWSAEECVKYLIERVGHEPSAAAAEVRRSIMGSYGPLYQAGYMLGGLQLRSLHKEVVEAGKMTNREFHDAILRENYVPFELLRAKMLSLPLSKKQLPAWKFYNF